MGESYKLVKLPMKIRNFIPLLIVVVFIGLREVALWCNYKVGSCSASGYFHSIFPQIINPAYTFSLFLLVPSIIILFVNTRTLSIWLKFAAWWIPLSIVVIYIGSSGGNGLMPIYSYSPSEVATPMAGLFAIISLVIMTWEQFKPKK